MKCLIKKTYVVDAVDASIIKMLSLNARLSIKALSRQVGLSAPSCSERLRHLERVGVIRGYRVDVNPEIVGFVLRTVIRIKAFTGQCHCVAQLLKAQAECVTFYKVTGEDDFICVAQLLSVEHLDELLESFSGIASTHTSIIKAEEHRLPVLMS